MSLLMPKATAVWLIDNTTLTFSQISTFCGLHALEIQAIADGEINLRITGMDPIASGQLTAEEIKRCEANPDVNLVLSVALTADELLGKKKPKYTPVSKRQDRPDAIAWIIKYHPEMSDSKISQLLGTTKAMIVSIKNKTHWNSVNIKPRSPVQLGLCTQTELDQAVKF
jgi:hypothetical protein